MTGSVPAPRFSIIVPTHDRIESLRRTVASLEAQTLPAEAYETIICDDGSTDGTAEYLASLRGPRFHVRTQPNLGAAAARNAGIRIARGTYLAFTDDDCRVPPTWLEEFERLFETTGADLVGGSAENELDSELSRFYQEMVRELYEARNRAPDHPEFLCANNLACRREALDRFGPFDTRFFVGGEDRELAARLLHGGGRVHFAPELRVRHAHAFSFGSFLRHFYRMGEGAYLLHRIVPRDEGAARPLQYAGTYLAFLGRILRGGPTPRALMRLGLFGMSQACSSCAFLLHWVRGVGGVAEEQRGGAMEARADVETSASEPRELDDADSRGSAGIPREIRTPLEQAIAPLEDLLRGSEGELPPRVRDRLEGVLRNCRRLIPPAERQGIHPGSEAPEPAPAPGSDLAPEAREEDSAREDDTPTVLVVDDYAEIRTLMADNLAAEYRVVEARDGAEALAMTRQLIPDLIISDVMMPVMDGHALCTAVKQDPELDFIPVILLTALASSENRIEGLTLGADDYVAKPFVMSELKARAANLIASRKRLRERFATAPAPLRPAALPVPGMDPIDAAFLGRVRDIVAARLSDEEFNVQALADALPTARSHLYRRLQELAGVSPLDFIRNARLERAGELLRATDGSVGEVAYGVGFKSVSHFCRAFREKFGVTPSVFAGVAAGREGQSPEI